MKRLRDLIEAAWKGICGALAVACFVLGVVMIAIAVLLVGLS